MERIKFVFVVTIICCLMLTGCGKDKIPEDNTQNAASPQSIETASPGAVSTPSPSSVSTEAEKEDTDTHENEARSKLTGEWIPKKEAKKRPYAVMINNISFVSPQHSGLSQASVLYEAVVEGGITRMMAIFENFDTDRIGSCRSARHYFVSFADEYDAIYVHFGHTSYAMDKIYSLGVDNISGLSGISDVAFYRDYSIEAPHNAFASSKGLKKAAERLGYRTEYEKGYRGHFLFNKKDTKPKNGEKAPKVSIFYSSYTSPYFEYNEKDKLYYHYQFGAKHVDANNNEQLKFKNLIIMLVDEWNIDSAGYQTLDIENSSGEGYYVSDNRVIPITWEKNESEKKCRYYTENGEELKLNPGKSYIGVVPSANKSQVAFK